MGHDSFVDSDEESPDFTKHYYKEEVGRDVMRLITVAGKSLIIEFNSIFIPFIETLLSDYRTSE